MLKQVYIETLITLGMTFLICFVLIAGLFYIIKEYKQKAPKTIKRVVGSSLLQVYVNKSSDMSTQATARFVAAQENNNYIQRPAYGYFATDVLMRKLDFNEGTGQFNINVVSQTCDINERRCTTLFELTPANGENNYTIYLTADTWNGEGRVRHKKSGTVLDRYKFCMNKEDNLDEFFFFEEEDSEFPSISLASSLHILYSADIPKNDVGLESLRYAINHAELELTEMPRSEREERTRMFYLRDDGESVSLEPRDIPMKSTSTEQLDSLYQPIKVTFQNETHTIKASKMIQILAHQLWSGGNAFVSGVMGTGKTTFMQRVMRELNKMEDCVIINVMPSQIRGLKNLRTQTQFIDQIRRMIQYEENLRVVIFLDEAESMMAKTDSTHSEDNTFIASLLDGEIKKVIHCGTAVTFNAARKDLNPILFRAGRVQFDITVEPFTKENAGKAVRTMKALNVDKVFDEARYNSILDTTNKDVSGKEYCAAGCITLADISGCFMEKDVASTMIEAIRGASMSINDDVKPGSAKTPPPPAKKPPVNPATQSINEKFAALKKQ